MSENRMVGKPTDESFYRTVSANRWRDVKIIVNDPRCEKTLDLNHRIESENQTSALILASKNGFDKIVRLLISKSPSRLDVNLADGMGNTALHYALQNGHVAVVETLISCPEIELEKRNELGQSPDKMALERLMQSGYGQNYKEKSESGEKVRQALKVLFAFQRQLKKNSYNVETVFPSADDLKRKKVRKPISPPKWSEESETNSRKNSVFERMGRRDKSPEKKTKFKIESELKRKENRKPIIPIRFNSDLRDRLQHDRMESVPNCRELNNNDSNAKKLFNEGDAPSARRVMKVEVFELDFDDTEEEEEEEQENVRENVLYK